MKLIDEKISAFVKRYVKATPPEEMEAACERNLQRLLSTVKAMEEPQAAVEQELIERLKPLEHFVLTAAYLLRGRGYAFTIWKKVNEMSEKKVYLGALYVALDRLENRGLVQSRWSDPTPERGGRATRFITVTTKGERALAHAREHQESAPGFLRGWIERLVFRFVAMKCRWFKLGNSSSRSLPQPEPARGCGLKATRGSARHD